MALKIKKKNERPKYVPTSRLYLTVDNEVVKAGDPRAASLLCVPGRPMDRALAERHGLVKQRSKAQDKMERRRQDK
jgi:hypothetical protein